MSQVTKEILDIASAALTLIGGIIGAIGTYFHLRRYQFFRGWEFLGSTLETLINLLTGGTQKALDNAKLQADFNPNEDDKAASLFGIHLIFIGFVLQGFGALVGTAEPIMQRFHVLP